MEVKKKLHKMKKCVKNQYNELHFVIGKRK